jgi:hypothetical protein
MTMDDAALTSHYRDVSINHLILKTSPCRIDQRLRETIRQTLYVAPFYACECCGLVLKNRFGKRGHRIGRLDAQWLNKLSRENARVWFDKHESTDATPGRGATDQ